MKRSETRKRQRKMNSTESKSKMRKGDTAPERSDDLPATATETPVEIETESRAPSGGSSSSSLSNSGVTKRSHAEVLDGASTSVESSHENLCESSATEKSSEMAANAAEKGPSQQSLERGSHEKGAADNREEEPSSQEETDMSLKRKKSVEGGLSASKIAKISDADAETSGEHSEDFKKCFEELGLMQYYDKFLEEGFEDLESVAAVKESDFEQLGVRRGHRRKILNWQQTRFSGQRRSLQQEDAKLEVKQWLERAGFVKYYDTFIDEGFDDMESLSLIEEEDLTAMKLKLGHKRKLLSRLNSDASASSQASESENTGPSVFLALSSFKGQKEGELSFSKGTLVTILEEYSGGICKGMADGKEGLFPKAALFQHEAHEHLTDKEAEREPLRPKESLQTLPSESSVAKINVNAPTPDVQRSKSDGDVADKNSAADTSPPVQSAKTLKELAAEEDVNKLGDVVSSGRSADVGPPKSRADDGRSSDGSGLERQRLQESAAVGKERGSQARAFQIRRPPKDQYLPSEGTSVDLPVDPPRGPVDRRTESPKQPEGTRSEEAESRPDSGNPAQKEPETTKTSLEIKTSPSNEQDLNSSDDEDSGEEYQNAFEDPSAGNEANLGLKQSAPGVAVTFNALLHPEWNLKKGKEVFIRFGIDELGNWKWNTITMTITQKITAEDVTLLQLSGNFLLPPAQTHQAIPYKYVVGKRKGKKQSKDPNAESEVEYEFLKKGRHGGILNRILLLPNSFRGCDKGYYVKYDDLIRRAPGMGGKIWQAFFGSSSRHVGGREAAIRQLLPKWTGFYCTDILDRKLITMLADEALTDLEEVVRQLKVPLVQENVAGSQPFPWHIDELDVSKILASVLKPKIRELGNAKPSDARKASERLVSAIAIAIVVKSFNLTVSSRGLDLEDFHLLSAALALPADFGNRTCECLKVVKENFRQIRFVLEALCNICNKVTDVRQPSHHWVFTVPLYHFLADLAEPFLRTKQLDWKKDEWWGLGLLNDPVRRYKSRADKPRLLVTKEALMPLFLLDPLLLHVVMFTSRFEDLKLWNDCSEFGYETVIAIAKKIEKQGIDINGDTPASVFRTVIEPIVSRLQKTTEDVYFASTGLQASVGLLRKMRHRLSRGKKDILRRIVDLIFSHLNVLNRTEATMHPATRSESSTFSGEETLRETAGEVAGWLSWFHRSGHSSDALRLDIQVWSDMLLAGRLTPDMAKCWCSVLSQKLQEKLKYINSRILLQAFSSLQDANLHPVVTECFFQVSEAAVRNTARNDPQAAFRSLSASARSNFGAASTHSIGLLRELLFRNLPADEAPYRAWLSSLVSWPLWGQYLRCSAEFFPESTSDVRRTLDRAKNVVNKFAVDVLGAQVSVADFDLIRKNQDCFLSLCQLLDEKEQAASSFKNRVAKALTQREEELQRFAEERKLVLNFVNVCLALGKIALGDIRDHSSQDVSDKPVSSLARRSEDGSITVVYFALPQEVGQYIKLLNRLQPSLIFQQLWRGRGDKVNEERGKDDAAAALPMNLGELVQQVIEPVFTVWEMMCGRVKKGDVSLHEVKTLFSRFSGDRKKLETELPLMERSMDTKWVTERVDQICLYNTLSKTVNAARAVIRVCDELNVSNSFPAVVEIASQDSDEDFHQRPLSSMTREVVSAGQFLADMTTKQIQCLHQFAECGPLIKWVREEIKE